MVDIPKIKKKISSFLTKEDGKISKESLIKAGVLLGAAALTSLNAVNANCPPGAVSHNEHCNQLNLGYTATTETASGTHQHGHGNHTSHSSHGSGCSPGSW